MKSLKERWLRKETACRAEARRGEVRTPELPIEREAIPLRTLHLLVALLPHLRPHPTLNIGDNLLRPLSSMETLLHQILPPHLLLKETRLQRPLKPHHSPQSRPP